MTAPHASDIINGYLARLEAETSDVPRSERQELLDSVREHIAEARAEIPTETDADLLNMLDRLGHPSELAAAERERLDIAPPAPARPGLLEIGALILTPLFWPIGIILLWTSSAWNTRDKLIGTFVPPGGFIGILLLGTSMFMGVQSCGGTSNVGGRVIHTGCSQATSAGGVFHVLTVLLIVLVIVSPILTGIYLGIQLRRRGTRQLTAALA